MQSIGNFSLTNNAGEVVKLQFVYWDAKGNKHHEDGTDGFPINQSRSRTPGESGVPAGSTVSLYCFVVWGIDVTADQQFIYDPNSTSTASYSVTGTTLDSHLTLLGVNVGAN